MQWDQESWAHLVVLLRFLISRLQAALRSRLIDMATRPAAADVLSYMHPLRARFGCAGVTGLAAPRDGRACNACEFESGKSIRARSLWNLGMAGESDRAAPKSN
jgi:hypothetical protein